MTMFVHTSKAGSQLIRISWYMQVHRLWFKCGEQPLLDFSLRMKAENTPLIWKNQTIFYHRTVNIHLCWYDFKTIVCSLEEKLFLITVVLQLHNLVVNLQPLWNGFVTNQSSWVQHKIKILVDWLLSILWATILNKVTSYRSGSVDSNSKLKTIYRIMIKSFAVSQEKKKKNLFIVLLVQLMKTD